MQTHSRKKTAIIAGSIIVFVAFLVGAGIVLYANAFTPNLSERSAEAAVVAFDASWDDKDCTAFTSVTSPEFREHLGLAECEAFVAAAEVDAAAEYVVVVDSVTVEGKRAIVSTTETREDPDTGKEVTSQWDYYLDYVGDGWQIGERAARL